MNTRQLNKYFDFIIDTILLKYDGVTPDWAKFSVGDIVTFVNEFDVQFPNHLVLAITESGEYHTISIDSPADSAYWMTKPESVLYLPGTEIIEPGRDLVLNNGETAKFEYFDYWHRAIYTVTVGDSTEFVCADYPDSPVLFNYDPYYEEAGFMLSKNWQPV